VCSGSLFCHVNNCISFFPFLLSGNPFSGPLRNPLTLSNVQVCRLSLFFEAPSAVLEDSSNGFPPLGLSNPYTFSGCSVIFFSFTNPILILLFCFLSPFTRNASVCSFLHLLERNSSLADLFFTSASFDSDSSSHYRVFSCIMESNSFLSPLFLRPDAWSPPFQWNPYIDRGQSNSPEPPPACSVIVSTPHLTPP